MNLYDGLIFVNFSYKNLPPHIAVEGADGTERTCLGKTWV